MPDNLSELHRRLLEVTKSQTTASKRLEPGMAAWAAGGRVAHSPRLTSGAMRLLPAAPLPASEAKKSVAISKWVDYSYKYGLGYQLSDGSVGVLFNDNTKMVLAPNQRYADRLHCCRTCGCLPGLR
jgi:hypothetical protein